MGALLQADGSPPSRPGRPPEPGLTMIAGAVAGQVFLTNRTQKFLLRLTIDRLRTLADIAADRRRERRDIAVCSLAGNDLRIRWRKSCTASPFTFHSIVILSGLKSRSVSSQACASTSFSGGVWRTFRSAVNGTHPIPSRRSVADPSTLQSASSWYVPSSYSVTGFVSSGECSRTCLR
jgi:hypothetical protein